MNLRICTCPDCIKKKTISNTGESISGCWLHPSTCAKHWSQHNSSLDNLENLALALPPTSPLSRRPEQNHPTSPVAHTSEESESELEMAVNKTEPECISKFLPGLMFSIVHAEYCITIFVEIIYLFIVWLSLLCGVSQQNCRIARDWIILIIRNFRTLPLDLNSYQSAHKDVRTMTKRLRLDPEIECYTCCPKCFSLYKPEYTPTTCCYRRSKKSQVCGKILMKSTADPLITQFQHISSAIQHRPDPPKQFVPHVTYHTQKFESWLELMGRLLTFNNPKLGTALRSRTTGSYLAMKFGLHSPCTMIPAPHKPDMTTISHILEPLVDELLLLNTSVFLRTPNFPNG
ncbi:hypothetical protein VP01_3567g3, partial [Puccinia sorghi]